MPSKTWYIENKERMQFLRKRHYEQNKAAYKARAMAAKAKVREWYNTLKKTLKCSTCPETDISCIDFHHKDRKSKVISIARAVTCGWSVDRLKKEIAKCIPLCSNCHRKLTAKELKWRLAES